MTTIYLIDEANVYTGASDINPHSQLPRCTLTPPPQLDGEQVAQWQGSHWLILQSYPQPDREQVRSQVVQATQRRLDEFANTRNYDNTDSISKYKDITDEEISELPVEEQQLVSKFRTECRYLAVMVARTWAKLYIILSEVEVGARQVPQGFSDIENELPELVWPI